MFERYASFIPDFEAFQAALKRPRDLYLRVNRLRISPESFQRSMRAWGHVLEPVPWYPAAFRASEELMKTRATLEYFLGLYYIQGAPSMIPPLALDPKPGERVLDLCAAPGSKTTQMCEMMGDQGLVVANDIYIDRLKILKGHVERLGITCALLTRKGGDSYPGTITFQKVLVDAPCSGEGTMRGAALRGAPGAKPAPSEAGGEWSRGKTLRRGPHGETGPRGARGGPRGGGKGRGRDGDRNRERREALAAGRAGPAGAGERGSGERSFERGARGEGGGPDGAGAGAAGAPPMGADEEAAGSEYTGEDLARLYSLQRALLRRAINLCEPGGTIVYSTCTYNPMENECVVDEALRSRDDLELCDIDLALPFAEPGLTEWEGKKFKSQMRKCLRFYPHRLNSWGFFVAKLRRRARSEKSEFQGAEEKRFQELVSSRDDRELRAHAVGHFEGRFGIPAAAFAPYALEESGHATWLCSPLVPPLAKVAPLDPQNPGLRLLRHLKAGEGAFEKPTSHGMQVLGKHATKGTCDLRGDELWRFLRGETIRRRFEGAPRSGFALVRFEGWVLGCGLMTAEGLVSQIPEAHGSGVRTSLFVAPGGAR